MLLKVKIDYQNNTKEIVLEGKDCKSVTDFINQAYIDEKTYLNFISKGQAILINLQKITAITVEEINPEYKLSSVHAFTQTIVGKPIKSRNKPKNVQNIHKQQKEEKKWAKS